MFTQQVLVSLLAAAQLATGAAVQSSFTVEQQDSGRLRERFGFKEMKKTFEKFGAPVPDHIRAAAAKETGTVSASPENFDKAYLSPVNIGTPAQTLQLDFDTGSSDLWVFSNQLKKKQQRGHAVYKPGKSSSSKVLTGNTWQIMYGDGSGASGNVYSDVVNIGGVTATTQAVEAAQSISASFVKSRVQDGLCGLGFSSINTVKPDQQTTFWDTVKGQLRKPVFAAYLRAGKVGSYDFGFINPTRFFGKLDYAPVDNSDGFWRFDASGYAVGPTVTNSSFNAIADTGTSLAYVPSGVASDYYAAVPSAIMQQGAYFFKCAQAGDLPNFSVLINGKRHIIPGGYINYAPAGQGFCFGGLQPNTGLPFSILGDVFLKSQYVVFNFAVPKIGFGNQK